MTDYVGRAREENYLRERLFLLLDAAPACINCEFWTETNETCSKFNCRPPAKVIARGCPQWEALIPF